VFFREEKKVEKGEKNYYEVLEISPSANQDEIYNGYIKAKNAYAQDSLALYSIMTKDQCKEILKSIDEAYLIISDSEKRYEYDKAKGIRNTESSKSCFSLKEEESFRQNNKKVSTSQIAKMVSCKKFSLNYDKDPQFEQDIEKTTEFNGEFLKKIREYRQVDIGRMSEMTKISKTYINCLEKEDIKNLPALVYVRGFVYQYAKCLKLNPDLVATSYLNRIKS
jgi:DnaJ-class molecular chaperone